MMKNVNYYLEMKMSCPSLLPLGCTCQVLNSLVWGRKNLSLTVTVLIILVEPFNFFTYRDRLSRLCKYLPGYGDINSISTKSYNYIISKINGVSWNKI